jgi:hypothetical protein
LRNSLGGEANKVTVHAAMEGQAAEFSLLYRESTN